MNDWKKRWNRLRVLWVIFLTSMGSSISQTVLECLAAELGHSLRPWESPTESQGRGRKTVRVRLWKGRGRGGGGGGEPAWSLREESRRHGVTAASGMLASLSSFPALSGKPQAQAHTQHTRARTHPRVRAHAHTHTHSQSRVCCKEASGLSAVVSFRYSPRELGLLGTFFHNCGKTA